LVTDARLPLMVPAMMPLLVSTVARWARTPEVSTAVLVEEVQDVGEDPALDQAPELEDVLALGEVCAACRAYPSRGR
jgi:hypothetical protein